MTTGVHAGEGGCFITAGLVLAGVFVAPPTTLAAEAYNWTGFYVGGNAGYGWGKSRTDDTFTLPAGGQVNPPGFVAGSATNELHLNGVIGGGQLGYNRQLSRIVLGVEADLQWSDRKNDTTLVCTLRFVGDACNEHVATANDGLAPAATFNQRLQWFGTVRGRIGALPAPDTLAYLTGGIAYGSIKTEGRFSGYAPGALFNPISSAYSDTVTKTGWAIGGGVEQRLFGRWTGRIEYLHIDLGTVSGTAALPLNFPPLNLTYNSRITNDIVRIGLDYRFDGPFGANN